MRDDEYLEEYVKQLSIKNGDPTYLAKVKSAMNDYYMFKAPIKDVIKRIELPELKYERFKILYTRRHK